MVRAGADQRENVIALANIFRGNIIDVSQGGTDNVTIFGEDCDEMRLKWQEGRNK